MPIVSIAVDIVKPLQKDGLLLHGVVLQEVDRKIAKLQRVRKTQTYTDHKAEETALRLLLIRRFLLKKSIEKRIAG